MHRKTVLFPEPDGPINTPTVPCSTRKLTPFSTSHVPRRLTRFMTLNNDRDSLRSLNIVRLKLPLKPTGQKREGITHRQIQEACQHGHLQKQPVLLAATEYCFESSSTAMTEQTAVSLKSAMKSLAVAGITVRMACGRMIRRTARPRDIPSERRSFHLSDRR